MARLKRRLAYERSMKVKEVHDGDDDTAGLGNVAEHAQKVGGLELLVRRVAAHAQRVCRQSVLEAKPVAALAEWRLTLRDLCSELIDESEAFVVGGLGDEAGRGVVTELEASPASRTAARWHLERCDERRLRLPTL